MKNLRDLITSERILVNPETRDRKSLLEKMAGLLFHDSSRVVDTYSITAPRLGKDDNLPGALFLFYRTGGDTPLEASLALFNEPLSWPGEGRPVSLVFLFSQPGAEPGYPLEILSQLSRLLLRRQLIDRLLAADSPDAVSAVLRDDMILFEREGADRREISDGELAEERRKKEDRRSL